MNHASLFSGIGACELAAEINGIENIFHCEKDEFCKDFLNKKYGGIEYGDITTADFKPFRGNIDILSGGFPCQDASIAKQHGEARTGLNGERTGLYRHMVRAIYEIRPRYVVAENVANLLKLNGGRDFGIILHSLTSMGYNVEWRVCNGREVGLCNQRKRVWIVANTPIERLEKSEYRSCFKYVQQESRSKRLRLPIGATLSDWSPWGGELQVSTINHGFSDGLLRCSSVSSVRKNVFQAIGNSMHHQIPTLIMKAIKEDFERNQ